MHFTVRIALLAGAAALLAACASPGFGRLEAARSSEVDVRRALGEPARVYADADGSRQLAYPQGPMGTQTYMAFLGPDGRLRRLEQVLSEEHFRRIDAGTTSAAQLERLIGPPWRTIAFPNKRQVAWDYVFKDTWGYLVDFSVMLDDRGIVAETAYVRREKGDDGDGIR